jgi:ABC-type sugar transport system ATPase subunit
VVMRLGRKVADVPTKATNSEQLVAYMTGAVGPE